MDDDKFMHVEHESGSSEIVSLDEYQTIADVLLALASALADH